MLCTNCGTFNREGELICQSCGKLIVPATTRLKTAKELAIGIRTVAHTEVVERIAMQIGDSFYEFPVKDGGKILVGR